MPIIHLWELPTMLTLFLCYFFSGMLLADLYSGGHQLKLNNRIGMITGGISYWTALYYFSSFSMVFFAETFFNECCFLPGTF